MRPVLIELGPFSVHSWGVMAALAFAAARSPNSPSKVVGPLRHRFRRRGDLAWLVLAVRPPRVRH